jgi:hypothetical protein
MTNFKTSKTELAELLKAKNISFRDWDDALSIHFSDGCDDFYYTSSTLGSLAEFIEKFQNIDTSRIRVLNALRHAAIKRHLFLDFDHSGSWSVGSKDGASWSIELGSELTKLIDEKGKIEACRIKLKELYSWETSAGCLGAIVQGGVMVYQKKFIRGVLKIIGGCIYSVAGGLAKNIMNPISFQSTDKQIINYINSHSEPPKHEHTWDEFEEREEERECIELYPDKEDDEKDSDDFQGLFDKFQKEGPVLIEADEQQKNEIDKSTASRIETFIKTLDEKQIDYDKIFPPWFNAPDDVWLKSDFLIEKLEKQAINARKKDDFWEEIGCLEQLLVLKCDKHHERTRQLMDEWWEGGGHDMQDYVELMNAFPDHPATAKMLEPCDMSPETSLEARRRLEVDIEREWNELKQFYKEDRVVKLDDILEIINKLSVDMIKKIMTEEQIHYIRRFCMEAAKGATVEDMQFSHEHILHTAWKMGWTDIAKTLRQRNDYNSLLFGFSMPASEIESWAGKVAETIGTEAPNPKDMPDTFDTFYFAKPLLIWSLFMPDEFTQRLTATALNMLKKGKGSKDDYLACSIAWQRCRS